MSEIELLDVDDDEEVDDPGLACVSGEFSASGSSRGGRCCVHLGSWCVHPGGGRVEDDGPEDMLGPSGGGGVSVCMWDAFLCSDAVGAAPRSTYLDPVMSAEMFPMSDKMSTVRVSRGVAILRCSGAALMRVPA